MAVQRSSQPEVKVWVVTIEMPSFGQHEFHLFQDEERALSFARYNAKDMKEESGGAGRRLWRRSGTYITLYQKEVR